MSHRPGLKYLPRASIVSHALRNESALIAGADGRYPVAAENYCLILPYHAMLDVNDGDMNERKFRRYGPLPW
jgi:hypothetical protein